MRLDKTPPPVLCVLKSCWLPAAIEWQRQQTEYSFIVRDSSLDVSGSESVFTDGILVGVGGAYMMRLNGSSDHNISTLLFHVGYGQALAFSNTGFILLL